MFKYPALKTLRNFHIYFALECILGNVWQVKFDFF